MRAIIPNVLPRMYTANRRVYFTRRVYSRLQTDTLRSVFSSGLRLHDALKRLVTEQRRRASVDTHAARREYDSKQRSGASFIKKLTP